MANKALATRQKMRIKVEPSQKAPRNPVAVAAKLRAAGPHVKGKTAERMMLKRLLAKAKLVAEEDE